MDYKGPENIYWLFSSSAQAIAAFIGFLTAGFFFSLDRMDKSIEEDETLEEVYKSLKAQYFRGLRELLFLTGLSICLSLLIVYMNGFALGWTNCVLRLLGAAVNCLTVWRAIAFVLSIIDPNRVHKAADKLVRNNPEIFDAPNRSQISRGEFLDRVAELEGVIRGLARDRYDLGWVENRPLPVTRLISLLMERGRISSEQQDRLARIYKVRNIAAHGEAPEIDQSLLVEVDQLINEIKNEEGSGWR